MPSIWPRTQLFVPESWVADAERRKRTHVPAELGEQSTFGVRFPDEVQVAAQEIPTYGGRGQPRKPRPAPQECGLDDFQGRRWDGLRRHLALVMLAYSFLALQPLQLPLPAGEDFPPQSRVARSSRLPASISVAHIIIW